MAAYTKTGLFLLGAIALVLIAGVAWNGASIAPRAGMRDSAEKYTMEHNLEVVSEVQDGIKDLLADGRYKCCLEKPCTYCFSDPEHQDKDLVCDCLEDIMNGKHPCGECIGEILEGNGNAFIAEYFATAIAEKVGERHLGALRQIISGKYDMPIDKQL